MSVSLDWLFDQLDVPSFEEDDKGWVHANTAAMRWIGTTKSLTWRQITEAMVGPNESQQLIFRMVDQARAGSPASALIDETQSATTWRVVALAVGAGRCRLIFAPDRNAVLDRSTLPNPTAVPDSTVLPGSTAIPNPTALPGGSELGADKVDLAAGVSHEFSNVLAAVRQWANIAEADSSLQTTTRQAIAHVIKASEAGSEIASALIDQARPQSQKPTEPVNVSHLLEHTSRLLLPKARKHKVTIETQITPNLFVNAAKGDLWSIFWNLAKNAIEAQSDTGGELQIRATTTKEAISIKFIDHGPGMDRKAQKESFIPFVSTKTTGGGLGLALVKKAVERAAGAIDIESNIGAGTTFVLSFPACLAPVQTPNPHATSDSATRLVASDSVYDLNNLGVLVVEDDESLRELLATGLAMRGAQVITCKDSKEALNTVGRFDMVLSDLFLPDARGDELLAELRQRQRMRSAILMSGGDQPEDMHPLGIPDAWLRKPFDLEKLFAVIAEITDSQAHLAATP